MDEWLAMSYTIDVLMITFVPLVKVLRKSKTPVRNVIDLRSNA
uniref:Uncharacterized protein n=1 Tax=Parascaris univalens TaxID=6257 RepID=A0A915BSY8_PARUN